MTDESFVVAVPTIKAHLGAVGAAIKVMRLAKARMIKERDWIDIYAVK